MKQKHNENLSGKAYFSEEYGNDLTIIPVNGKQSKVVCEEAKKAPNQKGKEKPQYILVNNDRTHHILQIRLDSGVFKNMQEGENRCDFLLLIANEKAAEAAVFVEIKGQDWQHGLTQLLKTIKEMQPNLTNCTCFARMVTTSKTPNLQATPKYADYAKPIKKIINGNLSTGKNKMEESAASFFDAKDDVVDVF